VSSKRKKTPPSATRKTSEAFTLRSRLSELELLCQKLEEIGRRLKISQRCLFEINLVLDEIFTNIISYGFQDEREHAIGISLTAEGDSLVVVVEDDGVPFNPTTRKQPDLPAAIEDCQIGGLGIHLIKNLVDEVVYCRRNEMNILTFRKKLERV
jgi:anti-sigma regulatory factor (Ser/Thr protein kinase)